MAERTEQSPDIRKPSAISYSRECNGRDLRDRLEGGTGHEQSSTLHSTMHLGGVPHQVENNVNRDVGHPPITPCFIPLNPPQYCSPPFTTYLDPGL